MTTQTTTAPAPLDSKRIGPALTRYRALAWITGIWLLVLTGSVIAKYGFGVHSPFWIGAVHGWCYFAYLIVTLDLAVKVRWPLTRTGLTLLAGTVPFLSFYFEHRNTGELKQRMA